MWAIAIELGVAVHQRLRWLRRGSQAFFLLLFTDLLLHVGRTAARPSGDNGYAQALQLSFQTDPFVMLLAHLGGRSIVNGWWLALLLIVAAVLAGRFYCGWICPMGTLQQLASLFPWIRRTPKQRLLANQYKPWQNVKYAVLVASVVLALFGSSALGFLDPLTIVERSLGYAIFPWVRAAARDLFLAADHSSFGVIRYAGVSLHDLWSTTALGNHQSFYRQSFFFAALFIAILILSQVVTRFWCRALCPLGALLGFFSRVSFLRLQRNEAACNRCQKCMLHCQGGDHPAPGQPWRKSECLLCLNCSASCPHGALRFQFKAENAKKIELSDVHNRRLIFGLGTGAILLPLLRSAATAQQAKESLLRPPGALEEKAFLSRCIRCGDCISACPTNALQPAFWEGGAEALWTPVLAPRIGACLPNCTLCSKACPTAAIAPITPKRKGWGQQPKPEKPIRLGTAFLDTGSCLPWATATACSFCETACPVTPKAIYLEKATALRSEGQAVEVLRPHVDPNYCVGCGACEYACRQQKNSSIRVIAIGESRSAQNALIVNGQDRKGEASGSSSR